MKIYCDNCHRELVICQRDNYNYIEVCVCQTHQYNYEDGFDDGYNHGFDEGLRLGYDSGFADNQNR